MPTEIIKIIDTGGTGDYTSLAAAIAAEKAARPNLVSNDEQLTFLCKCTDGNADTATVTINTFTTDGTRYVKVIVDPAYCHNGTYQTGNKYRIEPASGRAIGVDIPFVMIEGMQVKPTGNVSGYDLHLFAANSTQWIIAINCIAKGTNVTSTSGRGFNLDGASSGDIGKRYLINCIAYDYGVGYGLYVYNRTGSVYVYNCNVHNARFGFNAVGTTIALICKNCIYQHQDQTSPNGYVNCNAAGTNNISSIASDAPGANALDSSTPAFLDTASDDYRLSPLDTIAKGSGLSLVSDAAYPFDYDVQSRQRGSTWDRGFSQATTANKLLMII